MAKGEAEPGRAPGPPGRRVSSAVKARLLLGLVLTRPWEAWDRVRHRLAVRRSSPARPKGRWSELEWPEAIARLGSELDTDLEALTREPRLLSLQADIVARVAAVADGPFDPIHVGDLDLGRLGYALSRALAPEVVVETGVAYGLTSAFLLEAMEANRRGSLHSIDLPPLAPAADRFVGTLVPERSRPRWTLHRGSSRRLLSGLLAELGQIDLFLHDSLHTEANMTEELERAWVALRRPGIILSDDIDHNDAWRRFVARRDPAFSAVVRESSKPNLIGVALFR